MVDTFTTRLGLIAGVLVLAACDSAPEQPAGAATLASLPPNLCARAKEELQRIAKTAVFEHEGKGHATIDETIWLQFGKSGQDQLAQTMAIDAACASSPVPREQQVVIRGTDGRTLMSRIIEVAPDLGDFLEE
jgi:hypothetical protein